MNYLRAMVVAVLLAAFLAACSPPTATAPPSAPTATSEPAATEPASAAATSAASAPAVTTEATTDATPAAMDMGDTTGPTETYGPSIAAALPAVQPDLSSFPVTVENCGRTLTFDKPPERVVSLWQPPNEMLLALGVHDRIVALAGNYTSMPADLEALNKNITQIGSSMAWPSKEVLLTERPDLVVSEGITGFAFDAARGYATVEEIEATGANVFSTGSSCTFQEGQDRTMDAVYDDLTNLGKVFGVSARADALITQLQAREKAVVDRVAGKPPVKVAFYNGGEGPVNVLSNGVWADAMTKAGGENIFQGKGYEISVEEFAAAQPDVILIGYFPGQDPQQLIAFLKKTFPTVPAVQNNRLVPIPTIETEASVQIMDGLEKIARALHPEAFQ